MALKIELKYGEYTEKRYDFYRRDTMVSDSNQEIYERGKATSSKMWRLGLLTITSALAGGFTVAWWHRKTLTRLQNPIAQDDLQKFGGSFSEESSPQADE